MQRPRRARRWPRIGRDHASRARPAHPRLFVLARHAESTANTMLALSSDPARPVALTERGRAQARALGAQLANVHIDLAVGTRFQRTQETIGIALDGRRVPVLIEPGLDELRAGDLDGAPMETFWSWRRQHTMSDRLPHGESPDDALRRYASALRRLLARTEPVTLVVLHESALRNIALAADADGSPLPPGAVGNAIPFLFDEHAVSRAATSLDVMAISAQGSPGSRGTVRASEAAGLTTARYGIKAARPSDRSTSLCIADSGSSSPAAANSSAASAGLDRRSAARTSASFPPAEPGVVPAQAHVRPGSQHESQPCRRPHHQ